MPKRMVLEGKSYAATLLPFFRGLAQTRRSRDSFIHSPAVAMQKAGLIGTHVDVSQANRLVFSLITNKGFMKWAAAYQKKLPKSLGKGLRIGKAERAKVYEDCLSAMMKYADRELWVSLVGGLPGHNAGSQQMECPPIVVVYWDWFVGAAIRTFLDIVVLYAAVATGEAGRPYPDVAAELLRIADALAEAGVNKDLVTRATELRRSKKLADPRARFDK